MTEKTAKPAIEPISDEDLEGVVGAGDPVPYPDTGDGGSTKDVTASGDLSNPEPKTASGDGSGGLSSPRTSGKVSPGLPSGDVSHEGGTLTRT